MFRRGFPFRPPMPFLGFLNPMLQRILGQANQAFETGDFAQAAEHYTRLAERAVIRGKPRAGNWLIKAGQSNVLAGNKTEGMQQVFRGLDLLRTQGRQRDLGKIAWRTIELFKNNGLNDESRQVSDWVQGKAPEILVQEPAVSETAEQTPSRQRLPSKCPSCGAPVHTGTVDWVDNGQAACAYCDSLLPEG
ncbi:MAG: hypothetical protein WCG34_07850 [Leptolinea sp.]